MTKTEGFIQKWGPQFMDPQHGWFKEDLETLVSLRVQEAVKEERERCADVLEGDLYGDDETEERRIHNENQRRLMKEIRTPEAGK